MVDGPSDRVDYRLESVLAGPESTGSTLAGPVLLERAGDAVHGFAFELFTAAPIY